MDISDYFFMVIVGLTLVTLALLMVLGALAVYPRNWDSTVRDAAFGEIERRFAGLGQRSQEDLIAAGRMMGPEISTAADDEEQASAMLDALQVFTASTDRAELDAELSSIRDFLERNAVSRLVRLVSNVSSVRNASYLWKGGILLVKAEFAFAGFKWFFPCATRCLVQQMLKHSGGLTVIGIAAGILWAWISSFGNLERATFNWVGVASGAAFLVTVGGLILGVLKLYQAFLILRFGPANRWTRRGVLSGVAFVLCMTALMILGLSGFLSKWMLRLSLWGQSFGVNEAVERWFGMLVMVSFLAVVLVRMYRSIRNSDLMLSERVWILASVPVVATIIIFMLSYTFGISSASSDWILLAAGGVMLLLGTLAIIAGVIEWGKKYRTLKQFGCIVKRNGFRWWALIAWAFAGIVVTLGDALLVNISAQGSTAIVLTILFAALSSISFLWTIATLSGAIVSWLYFRRVSKAYETLRFELAPPHPYLAEQETSESNVEDPER